MDAEYIDGLWWLMHHSYAPGRKTYALTAYFDDSGSDDLSPMTTIGGPVMSKDAFIEFSQKWSKLLKFYRIPEPLHMVDFVRPHGKHIGMPLEIKLALFAEVAKLIDAHRIYSISVSISGKDFDDLLSKDVRRKLMGPYAMSFFAAVLFINGVSKASLAMAAEIVAYLIDNGFSFSDQLVKARAGIIESMKRNKTASFVGAMAFDDDERVQALQAADVIAWSARRWQLNSLNQEFEPLNSLMSLIPRNKGGSAHATLVISKKAIKHVADALSEWISGGPMPPYDDFIGMIRA